MTTQLVKLCYRNILETGNVSVTSENNSFPAYRLHDRDIGKLFKGNNAVTNFGIAVDQGANNQYAVDRLIIPAGHSLNGLSPSLQYAANNFPVLTISLNNGGQNYSNNEVITIVQPGASNATALITAVDGNGTITSLSLNAAGSGYFSQNGLATSYNGSGANATINVLTTEGNDANSWNQSGNGAIDREFNNTAARYWRLRIPNSNNVPELPELYLTKTYTFERNPNFGLESGNRKNVLIEETQSGLARFAKMGEPRKVRTYELTKIGNNQKADFESWDNHCEGTKSFYVEDHEGTLFFATLFNKDLIFTMEREDRWATRLELLEVL